MLCFVSAMLILLSADTLRQCSVATDSIIIFLKVVNRCWMQAAHSITFNLQVYDAFLPYTNSVVSKRAAQRPKWAATLTSLGGNSHRKE